MTEKPLVSCIVPTYKKFQYLWTTLDSVLSQDYGRIELIVVDDGSENFPSTEIQIYLNEKKNSNITNIMVYANETNIGTVASFNAAVAKSRGDYILPLSSDDRFHNSTVVTRIVRRFIEKKCDMIACRRYKCAESDLHILGNIPEDYMMPYVLKADTPKKQYLQLVDPDSMFIMVSGSALYYRRKVFTEFGYFQNCYHILEDHPIALAYTRKGGLIHYASDIFSIDYRLGGISTGGAKKGHIRQLIFNDQITMFDNEIWINKKQINIYNRMLLYIKYRSYEYLADNKKRPFYLWIIRGVSSRILRNVSKGVIHGYYKVRYKLYGK